MKRQLFNLLLVLSFVFSISAQKAQVAKTDATEASLRKNITYLASDQLQGRRAGEPGATTAAGYVANAFANIRLKPGVRSAAGKANFLQPFPGKTASPDKPVTGYNVIGILDGTDKTLKNEAIVIGAHYDHLGRGGEGSLVANSTEIHHGADDNASGTAAIIELARQFTKAKNNKRTIIFIAFSGEEEGLFGSKYYVNNPVFPIENTVAMINLDMVGRLHDDKLTIGGTGTASEWAKLIDGINSINAPSSPPFIAEDTMLQGYIQEDLLKNGIQGILVRVRNNEVTVSGNISKSKIPLAIQTVAERKPRKIVNMLSPSLTPYLVKPFTLQLNEDGFGPSDHSSFYTKKVPVLFFFTGTHLDYHKPSDTADKINYGGEEKVINYVAAIVKAIDQNPIKPTYAVAKSSGTPGGGRSGFSVTLGTIPSYTDSTDGMVVDGVREDSPASRAGMKANDKIVKLAGTDIKNVQDFTKVLGTLKADEVYEIVFVRGTETLTLKITPAKRQ